MFCSSCCVSLELLVRGGCGGKRAIYGCPKCDALFRQTTGGIISTPGGEELIRIEGGSYKRFKKTGSMVGETIEAIREELEGKK
ncbi:MAG: hypothetical protein V1756_02040 [Patescibacteria group bacterium]